MFVSKKANSQRKKKKKTEKKKSKERRQNYRQREKYRGIEGQIRQKTGRKKIDKDSKMDRVADIHIG